jgi:periplasmic divalent cation tolerance protein
MTDPQKSANGIPANAAPMHVLLSTFPDEDTARRIAHTLVEERLVACVNVLPGITSIYRWEGKVETTAEVLTVIKTGAPLDRVMLRLKELHPYDVPEMVVLPVADVLPAYLQWVLAETGGA